MQTTLMHLTPKRQEESTDNVGEGIKVRGSVSSRNRMPMAVMTLPFFDGGACKLYMSKTEAEGLRDALTQVLQEAGDLPVGRYFTKTVEILPDGMGRCSGCGALEYLDWLSAVAPKPDPLCRACRETVATVEGTK
jgi:hypothetical protein